MKRYMCTLCALGLLAVSLSNLFAQGNQPSQPTDPTAQADSAGDCVKKALKPGMRRSPNQIRARQGQCFVIILASGTGTPERIARLS